MCLIFPFAFPFLPLSPLHTPFSCLHQWHSLFFLVPITRTFFLLVTSGTASCSSSVPPPPTHPFESFITYLFLVCHQWHCLPFLPLSLSHPLFSCLTNATAWFFFHHITPTFFLLVTSGTLSFTSSVPLPLLSYTYLFLVGHQWHGLPFLSLTILHLPFSCWSPVARPSFFSSAPPLGRSRLPSELRPRSPCNLHLPLRHNLGFLEGILQKVWKRVKT